MTQTFDPLPAVLAGAVPEVCEIHPHAPAQSEGGELLEDTRDFTHSAGPWYSHYSLGQGHTRIYSARPDGPRGRLLATVIHFTMLPLEDSCADGRLMTSAPLLLEALTSILHEYGESEMISEATRQLATRAIVAAVDGYAAAEELAAIQAQSRDEGEAS